MTSKKATVKSTAPSITSVGLKPNSGGDTTLARDLPPVARSAPGDALYNTLEDFVLDQSEGEESSDENFLEHGGVSEGDGEMDEKNEGHL